MCGRQKRVRKGTEAGMKEVSGWDEWYTWSDREKGQREKRSEMNTMKMIESLF